MRETMNPKLRLWIMWIAAVIFLALLMRYIRPN